MAGRYSSKWLEQETGCPHSHPKAGRNQSEPKVRQGSKLSKLASTKELPLANLQFPTVPASPSNSANIRGQRVQIHKAMGTIFI